MHIAKSRAVAPRALYIPSARAQGAPGGTGAGGNIAGGATICLSAADTARQGATTGGPREQVSREGCGSIGVIWRPPSRPRLCGGTSG